MYPIARFVIKEVNDNYICYQLPGSLNGYTLSQRLVNNEDVMDITWFGIDIIRAIDDIRLI